MQLISERLSCRPAADRDLAALSAIYADPRTSALSPLAPVASEEQMQVMLRNWQQHWVTHGFGPWVLESRDGSELVGVGGISMRDFDGVTLPNLWYRFSADCWGRGLASEFAMACRDWYQQHFPKLVVHALVQAENLASLRILQKIGMQQLGELRVGSGKSLHFGFVQGSHAPC